jgi:hypothetical protein
VTVTKSTSELYQVVNGHEYANIAVRCWKIGDRFCGEIMINSSFGSWANIWTACGCPFKEFLATSDFDYLFGKFMGCDLNRFDGELSMKEMLRKVLRWRIEGELDRKQARAVWNALKDDHELIESSPEGFTRGTWEAVRHMDPKVRRLFAEPFWWIMTSPDACATDFWRMLWPDFKAALLAERTIAVPA